MAATLEDANLESRRSRSRLVSRHIPYWHALDEGGELGYFKGQGSAVWIARFARGNGRYAEQRISLADVDDVDAMDIEQVRRAARNCCAAQAVKEARRPIDDAAFTVVGAPCNRD